MIEQARRQLIIAKTRYMRGMGRRGKERRGNKRKEMVVRRRKRKGGGMKEEGRKDVEEKMVEARKVAEVGIKNKRIK